MGLFLALPWTSQLTVCKSLHFSVLSCPFYPLSDLLSVIRETGTVSHSVFILHPAPG